MFNFFKSNSEIEKINEIGKPKLENEKIAKKSNFGRGITSIQSAKQELSNPLVPYNPLDFLNKNSLFFGLDFLSKDAVFLSKNDVTHSLIVGPTRSGKGVLATIKIIESLRNGRGVIVIDPKQDDYLPLAILEELKRQNRLNDLQIVNFPNDYGYSGFEETDTETEFVNKLVSTLDLFEVEGNAGSNYYRKNERILLKKLIFLFFNSKEKLNIEFKKNWKSLINFSKYLYKDLENETLYFKEITKMKPNSELLDRFANRFFNPSLFAKLDFNEQDLGTLKGLFQTLKEFENINIYSKFSVKNALFNGKVLYIKSDMLDETALKLLKLLVSDIILQSRKSKGAKCDVFADELSFYPTQTLSSALATIAGFGVYFTIMYQDDAQLKDENLKKAIKSNCQLKIYYKSSDLETLNYIKELGGLELVTKITKKGNETSIRQEQESLLNITRLRALPRQFVGVLISESLNEPKIIQSYFVKTNGKFNWDFENKKFQEIEFTKLNKSFSIFEIESENNEIKTEIIELEEEIEEDF